MTKPKGPTKEAETIYRRAIQQQDKGYGVKAFRLFLQAAKLGHEQAQVKVAYDYAYGETGAREPDEALHWWKLAYKQHKSWDAAFNLGCYFRDKKEWDKALKWFERAVRSGDPDGLVEIAKIHLRWGGDRPTGLKFLQQALVAKDTLTLPARQAAELLEQQEASKTPGEILYFQASALDYLGRHTDALPLLEQGAEAGHSNCQGLLANYLADGRKGIPKDRDRSIELYKRAFSSGVAYAAGNLAVTLRKEGKLEEAWQWYEAAISAGDESYHLDLARICLHEQDNPAEAIRHLNAMFQSERRSFSDADYDEARTLLRRLSKATPGH